MGDPHILVIPYPAQGHVIPLMELSQRLARYGFKITFVNTEHNHEKILKALPASWEDTGDKIDLVSIPDGLESPEDRFKPGKLPEKILRFIPGKLEELLLQINGSSDRRITCVIADQSLGWASEIAEKHGIKHAAFCPAAAAMLIMVFNIPKLIDDGIIDNDGTPTRKQKIKLSSTMPEMNTKDFVWACLGSFDAQKNIFELMVRNNESVKLTSWLLCNSAYDLEPAAFTTAPQIRPIGPLLASNQLGESAGNFWPKDLSCLKWLDQQEARSVIYVAFGSFTVFDPIQFQELALGLELTNWPFLWVVRPDITDRGKDPYPEGFLERIAARGQTIGWGPQQKILSHPSIACFMSHCGWNSTLEGISNGIPFLCWPYFADQFVNQSYISDFWKVGLQFDRDERGMITREEIKIKVEELLGNEEYKARALALKDKVMRNIKEDGASYKKFRDFVEWVKA